MVTEGPSMKRYKVVGTGRRAKPPPMLKRSSHATIVLAVPGSTKQAKDAKAATPKPATKKAVITKPKSAVKKDAKAVKETKK